MQWLVVGGLLTFHHILRKKGYTVEYHYNQSFEQQWKVTTVLEGREKKDVNIKILFR